MGPFLLLLPLLTAADSGRVVRLDPAFDNIAAPDGEVEKLASGFTFVEGPVWAHEGYLLFSDLRANRIMRWSPQAGATWVRR